MPRQDKTPKKKSKKKSPQKIEESEYPLAAMDQAEMNRLIQNGVEHVQAELQQKHEEHIKALEANREAQIKVVPVEDRLTKKFQVDEPRHWWPQVSHAGTRSYI